MNRTDGNLSEGGEGEKVPLNSSRAEHAERLGEQIAHSRGYPPITRQVVEWAL